MHIKPTRRDYAIAIAGIVPIAVAQLWRQEIAAWMHVSPKLVSAAGVILSASIIVFLSLLGKNAKDHREYSVQPLYRLLGFAGLCIGIVYFWAREEIADLVGWQLRFGDGLVTFVAVIGSLWLLSKITSANRSDNDA